MLKNVAQFKIGHSQFQIRPRGVKTGQYPPVGTGRNRPLAVSKPATLRQPRFLTVVCTENLVTKGIIDPTKVVRAAIQNAASVAGLLITTEAMVAKLGVVAGRSE
jgi:hypothetical protein